ncbi:MAG: hypothetical protein ABJF09_08480 [Qipengyuania citrea]|uniref:hypothetical protein n=1 Tax=Qipengyuania citrea TaxID=225971 RepID=UPI00326599F5
MSTSPAAPAPAAPVLEAPTVTVPSVLLPCRALVVAISRCVETDPAAWLRNGPDP